MIAELPSAERGLAREGCRRPDQPPRVLPRETGPGMARSLTPPFSSEEHEGARGEGIDPSLLRVKGGPTEAAEGRQEQLSAPLGRSRPTEKARQPGLRSA